MILLAVAGSWFPTQGILDPDTPPEFFPQVFDVLHHLVLPCLTLVAVLYAQYLLVMRSSLLEEMNSDYLTPPPAPRAFVTTWCAARHAVPNALLPTVTLIFINLGFVSAARSPSRPSTPGPASATAVRGDHRPRRPAAAGLLLVLAGAVLVMNLIGDLLLRVIDPRVRAA
ncbi:hypothetical protein GCM10018954_062890 [Kutzneria kofuensis]